jgi:hypothetical protein
MEEAVKKHGTSWANIAKEYFSDCNPVVTRTDVQNFVTNNPYLSKFCQSGIFSFYHYNRNNFIHNLFILEHKRIKEESHRNFLKANQVKKEEEESESESEDFSLFPHTSESGVVTVPNINFLATPPFFVQKPDKYVYFYRLHLAQDLDIDYDSDNRLLKFEIISIVSLLPCEKEGTKLFEEDADFQAIETEEKLKTICNIKVPDDARLDDSIFRNDIDNETGALVEVHVLRKKEEDKSKLRGKRNHHMKVNVATTTALQHNPAESSQNTTPNSTTNSS